VSRNTELSTILSNFQFSHCIVNKTVDCLRVNNLESTVTDVTAYWRKVLICDLSLQRTKSNSYSDSANSGTVDQQTMILL
jgi:hypothetical protein